MNAITPAPLRKAAPLNSSQPVSASYEQPADPAPMIMKPLPKPGAKVSVVFLVVVLAAAGFVAELTFREGMRPSEVLGEAVARFHKKYMDAVNEKEAESAEINKIAENVGDIANMRSTGAGVCAVFSIFDQGFGQTCRRTSDMVFDAAEQSARNSQEKNR